MLADLQDVRAAHRPRADAARTSPGRYRSARCVGPRAAHDARAGRRNGSRPGSTASYGHAAPASWASSRAQRPAAPARRPDARHQLPALTRPLRRSAEGPCLHRVARSRSRAGRSSSRRRRRRSTRPTAPPDRSPATGRTRRGGPDVLWSRAPRRRPSSPACSAICTPWIEGAAPIPRNVTIARGEGPLQGGQTVTDCPSTSTTCGPPRRRRLGASAPKGFPTDPGARMRGRCRRNPLSA